MGGPVCKAVRCCFNGPQLLTQIKRLSGIWTDQILPDGTISVSISIYGFIKRRRTIYFLFLLIATIEKAWTKITWGVSTTLDNVILTVKTYRVKSN